jgi:hypothetical protein
MQRQLVITLVLDTPLDDEPLELQFEAVFEGGTAREALAEGMGLHKGPRLVSVRAERYSLRRPPR